MNNWICEKNYKLAVTSYRFWFESFTDEYFIAHCEVPEKKFKMLK